MCILIYFLIGLQFYNISNLLVNLILSFLSSACTIAKQYLFLARKLYCNYCYLRTALKVCLKSTHTFEYKRHFIIDIYSRTGSTYLCLKLQHYAYKNRTLLSLLFCFLLKSLLFKSKYAEAVWCKLGAIIWLLLCVNLT